MKLLLVEDDQQNREFLYKAFNEQGYTRYCAARRPTSIAYGYLRNHDIIILDRMLPKLDGLQVLAALRATGKNTPITYTFSLDKVDERVAGLNRWG
ncbi:response regulator (plasmid) [Pseudoalteromonas espejiana]